MNQRVSTGGCGLALRNGGRSVFKFAVNARYRIGCVICTRRSINSTRRLGFHSFLPCTSGPSLRRLPAAMAMFNDC